MTGPAERALEQHLDQLAEAGISTADVQAVTEDRVRRRRAAAADSFARITRASIGGAGVDVGLQVPQEDRWSKGPTLTRTDIEGYYRVRAAALASLRRQADARDVDQAEADELQRATVLGMVRRENDGKHQDNLDRIALARTAPAVDEHYELIDPLRDA